MVPFLLVICLVVTYFVVKRTGFMSPASVACLFSSASLLLFCWIGLLGGYEYNLGGLSFAPTDYSGVAGAVFIVYTAYIVVVALSTIGLSKEAMKDTRAIEAAKAVIKKLLDSDSSVVVACGLALLCICHNCLVYWIGDMTNPLLKLFAKGGGVICILSVAVIVYCWPSRRPLAVLIAFFAFLGEFQFLLRDYSRWCPLVTALAAVLIAGRRRSAGKSVFGVGTVVLAIVTLDLFLFDLQFKRYRSEFPPLDFVLPQLFQVNVDVQPLAAILINLLQGPMILAEAVRMGVCRYPDRYMLLSFSPFISAIDHFNAIVHQDEWRVNINTPFNNFAELYNFSWQYIVVYAVATFVVMRQVTKVYLRFGPLYGLLLVAPILESLLAMHQYPIRNTFRLMIYPAILSAWAAYKLNKSVLARARLQYAEWWRSKLVAAARDARLHRQRPTVESGVGE